MGITSVFRYKIQDTNNKGCQWQPIIFRLISNVAPHTVIISGLPQDSKYEGWALNFQNPKPKTDLGSSTISARPDDSICGLLLYSYRYLKLVLPAESKYAVMRPGKIRKMKIAKCKINLIDMIQYRYNNWNSGNIAHLNEWITHPKQRSCLIQADSTFRQRFNICSSFVMGFIAAFMEKMIVELSHKDS